MQTYEVEFKNNIGNRIVFTVNAESEEHATNSAYDEMESEGYSTDDNRADGYYLNCLEVL